MPGANCYVLDGQNPVLCKNIEAWCRFMDEPEQWVVASEAIGKFNVVTSFVGINLGDLELPKFFKTVVEGSDGKNPARCYSTWGEEIKGHEAYVASTRQLDNFLMNRDKPKKKGFRFKQFEAGVGELRFVMESEEAAIAALPQSKGRWTRDGENYLL